MSYDLVPSRLFNFPSIWNDDEDLMPLTSNASSGLSISEDDKNIYVEASVPGIDPKNIDITFHDGNLWINGETKEEESDKIRKYYRQATKSFSYRVAVPGEIDQNQEPIATYKHGVMKVAFVKSPQSQPKKIQIKTDSEN